MSKRLLIALGLLTAAPALAHDFDDDVAFARVVQVQPRYVVVSQPRQECWDEVHPVSRDRSIGGAVIGGIAGGLIGNTVGRGNGNKAAIAAGAITGTIVGDRIQHDRFGNETRVIRQCRTVNNRHQVQEGYLVTYRLDDRLVTTVMPQHPGRFVRVPVERRVVFVDFDDHGRGHGRHHGHRHHHHDD